MVLSVCSVAGILHHFSETKEDESGGHSSSPVGEGALQKPDGGKPR